MGMTLQAWLAIKQRGMRRRLGMVRHSDSFLALYDLGEYPASYDVIYVMIAAQARAVRQGLSRVDAFLVDGVHHGLREEEADYEASYPAWQRNTVVSAVVEQIPRLAPFAGRTASRISREDATWLKDQYADYVDVMMENQWNPLNRLRREAHVAWREMGRSLAFKASEGAKRLIVRWLAAHGITEKPIVLTMRDRLWSRGRNSNGGGWMPFLALIREWGVPVVVIPDTERIFSQSEFAFCGARVCLPASLNVEIRLALCELARMNFTVNTGPGTMLLFTGAPYRYFANYEASAESSRVHWDEIGLPKGSQLSGDLKAQKIVWDPDTLEKLKEEFESVLAETPAGAIAG